MKRINLIIWDIMDTAEQWMEKYLEKDRCQILEVFRSSRLSETDIQKNPEWDYILIFSDASDERFDVVGECLEKAGITMKEILFPLLMEDLIDKWDISHYLFKGKIRGYLEFFLEQSRHRTYMTCTVNNDLSYISAAFDNAIMGSMYLTGKNWAEQEIEKFFSLIRNFYPEALNKLYFFDIGANIGTTSIYVKKKIAPEMHIIAFEPVPEIFKFLKINFFLNDICSNDYTLVNMGISARSEEREIRYHKGNIGGSSFVEQEINKDDTAIMVRNISFDDYIEQNKIKYEEIACLWIDIEGFEAMFLQGAYKTLSQITVPVLMEFSPVLLKKVGMYEMFLDEIKELYSHYIVIQEGNQILPIRDLGKRGDSQVDIFLMKDFRNYSGLTE